MKNYFYPIIFFLLCTSLHAQTITRTTSSQVAGTVCPVFYTYYEVSIPTGFSACKIAWSAVNGTVMSGGTGTTVGISWNDTPGAISEVKVTFTDCDNSNNNTTKSLKELILSVKNQAWGAYDNSIDIDYCTTREVVALVPRMFVAGTGGIAQPPLQEVLYGWTLPAGWREKGTGRTGYVVTSLQSIIAEPTGCAKTGLITVEGVLNNTCPSAAQSAKATITLNGVDPVVTLGPQAGYSGGSACNRTPVTFYATTNVALGCINTYNWTYPPSWTVQSQNGNSITLTPSGIAADAAAIKVTLKLNCGTDLVSGNYVPPFKDPKISLGSPNVCSGGSSVTLLNSGSNAAVTWSTSSNMTIASGQGTNQVTIKGNSPFMGSNGTISAIITSCPAVPVPSMSVFQGLPYLDSEYSTGSMVRFTYPPNAVEYNMVCNLISKTVNMVTTGGTGSWQRIAASPTNTSWSSLNGNVSFYFFQANQTATFRYTANNSCGQIVQDFSFQSKTCGSGGCPQFTVSPNPSDKNLRIAIPTPNIPAPCGTPTVVPLELSDNVALKEEPKAIQSVSLFDSNGVLKLSRQYKDGITTTDLDISDLKKGIYMLIITTGEQSETHRIIKE